MSAAIRPIPPALRSVGLLDGLFKHVSGALGRAVCIHARLHRLAPSNRYPRPSGGYLPANPGEKCGPGRPGLLDLLSGRVSAALGRRPGKCVSLPAPAAERSRRFTLARRAVPAAALAALLCGAAAGAERPVVWLTRIQGRALSAPVDVAVDRRGITFLLDAGSRSIGLVSPRGEVIREINTRAVLRDPAALTVAPDGAVFVADGSSGRVLEVDMTGRVRREYPVGKGSRITGVGVFGDSVYCADNANAAVVVFRRGGQRTGGWGGKGDAPGKFNAPFRIAVDPAGRIFVTDVMNARVQWFSAFGQHLGTLKKFGAGEGKIFRPAGVFIDRMGRIWVSDSYTGLVQLFDQNGTFVRSLGSGGRPFVFGDPVGVAEGPEGIWVADQRGERAGFFPK